MLFRSNIGDVFLEQFYAASGLLLPNAIPAFRPTVFEVMRRMKRNQSRVLTRRGLFRIVQRGETAVESSRIELTTVNCVIVTDKTLLGLIPKHYDQGVP